MVNEHRLMTAMMLLPYLNPFELAKFCRLNKASFHIAQKIVNFKVLFESQGIQLTPKQVNGFKFSVPLALKIVAKL